MHSATINNYKAIDFVKFFMALCVVTIHTNVASIINTPGLRTLVYTVIHCAVPFFFMASGYLLAIKILTKSDRGGYFYKLMKIYLEWSLIHFVITSVISRGLSIDHVLDFLHKFIFVGYAHLWYVWGDILVLPLLLIALKKGIRSEFFLIIAILSYFLMRGISYYAFHQDFPISDKVLSLVQYFSVKNLCIATTYLSLGIWTAQTNLKPWICYLLIVLGAILAFAGLDSSGREVAIEVPIIAIGLFSVIRDANMTIHLPYKWMRSMSTYIYFCHGIIISLIATVFVMPSYAHWITTLLVTSVLSSSIIYAKNKTKICY